MLLLVTQKFIRSIPICVGIDAASVTKAKQAVDAAFVNEVALQKWNH